MFPLRPNLQSIVTRITLFWIGLLLVSTVALVLLLNHFLRKDLIRTHSDELLALANYAAQDIDRHVVERREMLQELARQVPPGLLNNPERLYTWLVDRHDLHPVFTCGLVVIDLSGRVVASCPTSSKAGDSYLNRDVFHLALKEEFAIGRPYLDAVLKRPVLSMGTAILDWQGKPVGVVVGTSLLDSTSFLNALSSTRIGRKGGLVLVSPRDQLFLGDSRGFPALTPTPKKGMHRQHDSAMEGFRGVGVDRNSFGEEELAAVVSIPSSGWFLVARLPTSEVFSPMNSLRQIFMSAFVVLVLVIILVMIVGLRYLMGPLKYAAEHADKMSQEEIPLKPLPVVRQDEVGELTEAFNRILDKLLASQAQLEHLAHHDSLTGLPNRKLLNDRMQQALGRARRSGTRVALLMLDLDGFKNVNDEMGHSAGDEALRQVAARLGGHTRCEDTVARIGGDEFVILLTDQQEQVSRMAERVAYKCLESLAEPFEIFGIERQLGTSIGIAIGDGSLRTDELLAAADHAMYRAKESGGGGIAWAELEEGDDLGVVAGAVT
ncbi:diguanylate cyclase domain-containing protein [Geomesophilobacter sediminis]|uniref:Diguanylate cyclase n=1 Tax=Geomesophilobacter sediminis TaxID=2798584 RepID=A0A8J7IZK6_9BACT|nr:diguanylate cyclase [Geomesophilobacter sediminis]MBJ6725522.1 diguanylate cyclase [Geomesophilobacter sediminis]